MASNNTFGLAPPRGRLGYSLPTPRALGKGPLFVAQPPEFEQDVYEDEIITHLQPPSKSKKTPLTLTITPPATNTAAGKGTWYTTPREPLSPLDQIRPLPQMKFLPFSESWMEEDEGHEEEEEEDDSDLLKLTNRLTLTPNDSSNLQRFTGDSLLSFNYNLLPPTPQPTVDLGGSFVSAFSNPLNSSLNLPFLASPSKDKESQFLFPSTTRNPNKALITINATTSVILMANKVASQLFGYPQKDLIGLKIQQLFTEPYQSRQRALAEQNINTSGQTVLVSGKVMDAVTSTGMEFPVSVWMKKVSSAQEPRVIVVIEPVERCTANFTLDDKGHLESCDPWFATLFGYDDVSELKDQPLFHLIPSISLEKVFQKQSLTGRTKDGNPFPLILKLFARESSVAAATVSMATGGKVIVYASLSGMISFLPNGTIHGCNHHFSHMLLGHSQDELLGKDITFLIPDFYSLVQSFGVADTSTHFSGDPSPNKDISNSNLLSSSLFQSVSEKSDYNLDFPLGSISEDIEGEVFIAPPPEETIGNEGVEEGVKSDDEGEEDALCVDKELVIQFLPNEVIISDDVTYNYESSNSDSSILDSLMEKLPPHRSDLNIEEPVQAETHTVHRTETETTDPRSHSDELAFVPDQSFGREHPSCISTPAQCHSRPSSRLSSTASSIGGPDGFYTGYARHKDGSLLSIIFQLKQIIIDEGHTLYCLWLMRDSDFMRAKTADLSRNTPDPHQCQEQQQQISPEVISEHNEEILAKLGEYSNHYDTHGPIGHGAFGFVKLASRREDGEMVVVKFIRKATVIPEHWVEHEMMGLVPREICILAEISHINIVQLLEAYENVHYFQLVMDKHGDGMDLFTFIEAGPQLDEPLISYMVRQVVSALDYLHKRSILHRDVKDENIILNDSFHMKLIDFGSAAYMKEGELFNTFCGTLEYCSPEVLMGNSYVGPELEMWSLGVTLYTLVYGENPFFDVEEIIGGHLQPPFLVSPGLLKTILWLLHPDPKSRATLYDLQTNSWINQQVDVSQYSFDSVVKKGGVSDVPGEGANRENDKLKMPDAFRKQYLLTRTLT